MAPIEKIPENLLNEFTQNGEIPVLYQYRNDSSDEVQKEINSKFIVDEFKRSLDRINKKQVNYYGDTDTWLYSALQDISILNKDVCIIGSTYPWYEAMALVYGARTITVIEYSDRKSFHKSITYLKPSEVGNAQFDACFSISSYEHDGLGRYGDPINPNGDIEAMNSVKSIIKKNGVMFLSVPIGKDCICFNVHRIYGEKRFYRLIQNWKPLNTYGFRDDSFELEFNSTWGTPYQPIITLENT